MNVRKWGTAIGAALLLAGACSQGVENPNHPLANVLIRSAPEGYEPVDGPASGPMSIEDAAATSTVDVGHKMSFLKRSGFQDGYSRVWTKGDDYVIALAHELATERSAKRLVEFEIEEASGKVGTATFTLEQIPDAKGYILSGVKRKGLDNVFCQSIWFPHRSRAFSVTTCSPQPGSPNLATQLAAEQYELATLA